MYILIFVSLLDTSGGSVVKNPPAVQETLVPSLDWEDPLEKEMATHSSVFTWKISRTEGPGSYSPWGHKESDTTEQLITHAILILCYSTKLL